jgi:hypothetical protein
VETGAPDREELVVPPAAFAPVAAVWERERRLIMVISLVVVVGVLAILAATGMLSTGPRGYCGCSIGSKLQPADTRSWSGPDS